MKIIFVLFIACSLFSCKETPNSKNNQNSLKNSQIGQKTGSEYTQRIVPAHHLGAIKLKVDAEAVYDSLGTPDAGDAAMQKAVATWNFKNPPSVLTLFTAIKDQNSLKHKVYLIRSTSPAFKTENGLGVNSSLEAVKAQFSLEKQGVFIENEQEYTLYETEKGIGFEFDKNQICYGVIVHEPDARANQTYLPIYADFNFETIIQ